VPIVSETQVIFVIVAKLFFSVVTCHIDQVVLLSVSLLSKELLLISEARHSWRCLNCTPKTEAVRPFLTLSQLAMSSRSLLSLQLLRIPGCLPLDLVWIADGFLDLCHADLIALEIE